jgi:hypothetical protein
MLRITIELRRAKSIPRVNQDGSGFSGACSSWIAGPYRYGPPVVAYFTGAITC